MTIMSLEDINKSAWVLLDSDSEYSHHWAELKCPDCGNEVLAEDYVPNFCDFCGKDMRPGAEEEAHLIKKKIALHFGDEQIGPEYDVLTCSKCGEYYSLDKCPKLYNYCPNCGAKISKTE